MAHLEWLHAPHRPITPGRATGRDYNPMMSVISPLFPAAVLPRTAATRLGRLGHSLLGVGATCAALLSIGVAAAHAQPALFTTFGGAGTGLAVVPPAPAAPQVMPNSEGASSVTPTTATLQAAVNPEFADTHYIFEYGPTAAYGTQVPLPPGTDIGESGNEQSAAVGLTGLAAQSTYHFRVVATNSVGTTDGPDAIFTTLPPAPIDSELATNVTATAADLRTEINPEGVETHYRFEYGTTPSYGAAAPVPDGAIGAVAGDQGAAVHVEGLQPSTRYYFRVLATNALGTSAGGVQTFTTYPPGGPSALPDNRAYELVSPVEADGGDVGGNAYFAGDYLTGNAESSLSGSAVAYISTASFSDSPSAMLTSSYLSSRGPSGWSTRAISPSATVASGYLKLGPALSAPYRAFTPELTAAVLEWSSPLAAGQSAGYYNVYLHELGASPSPYQLLTTAGPAGEKPGYEVRFAGASPDLAHIVVEATSPLTEGEGAPAGAWSVYEWAGGRLRLVSILPGPGSVAAAGAKAGGGEDHNFANDVSADGSRVFWTYGGQLYVRENGTTTVELTPSLGNGSATFRAATPDGSKVFFTDETPLTNNPDDNGGLYEYDFNGRTLTDLSLDSGGSPGVEGVVGASEDGSSVYFVASGGLATGASTGANNHNLYLSHDGGTTFIAALNSEDKGDWEQNLEERTARVTPDGEHLAFMSREPLTGYDNIDVNTGAADTEVFVYDASTGGLSCASCNPSGERPIGSSSVPTGKFSQYVPRYISDNGRRVFFDSSDALVPAATNGRQNVYEYENGAIYLISAGTSEDISAFADASPNGNDLFFTTRAQLVPEVNNTNAHMYDARVDGGFPAGALAPEQCSGEGCRGPVGAPPVPAGIATESDGAAMEAPATQAKGRAKPKKHVRKSRARHSARRAKGGRPARKSKVRGSRHGGAGRQDRHSGRRRGAAK